MNGTSEALDGSAKKIYISSKNEIDLDRKKSGREEMQAKSKCKLFSYVALKT